MNATMPTTTGTPATQLVTHNLLDSITAFVAEGTVFRGDFSAQPGFKVGIKIDGVVEGSISIPEGGVIHIGPTGRVVGPLIEADHIYVEGNVEGKTVGRVGVEFSASSWVKGTVEYKGALNIHNLAKVRASVSYAGADE